MILQRTLLIIIGLGLFFIQYIMALQVSINEFRAPTLPDLFKAPFDSPPPRYGNLPERLAGHKDLQYVLDVSNPFAENFSHLGNFYLDQLYTLPRILHIYRPQEDLFVNCSNDTAANKRLEELDAEWVNHWGDGIGLAKKRAGE